MRRHTDLSMSQAERIAESKLVPCPMPHTRRGCGAPVGERCRSLANGAPLGGLGAHVDRLLAARTARPGPLTSTLPAPRPEPDRSRPSSDERSLAAA